MPSLRSSTRPQGRAPVIVERGGVAPAGPTPDSERLPEILEALVAGGDDQGALLDVLEAARTPEPCQLPFVVEGHGQALVERRGEIRLERGGGVPERSQERHLARVVPDARSDDAARPRHPAHLGDARARVLQEVEDELGERGVEGVVREGQVLGGGDAGVHPRQTLAHCRDEWL